MMGQFRILPVLIFVAMLAFSVRLADVALGIRHLSGTAQAEEKSDKKDSEQKKEEEKPKDKQTEPDMAKNDDKKEDAKTESAENPDAKEPEWRDAGDSDLDITAVKMEVMEDVSRRNAKLDQQEKNLNAREALLKATEQEIDRKFQELTKLRAEIEGLLGKQTEEEEKRIASLVKIYEGMKPKEAARIFDTLDLDILVSVVSKMSERKISPILGIMEPERAKTLTIMLAEQKQLPSLAP